MLIKVADENGNIVASYTYDPWGSVLSVTGSDTAIGNLNPFRYRSYYYDSNIQMYYLQSRYYDPEVGRFINCDDVNYIGLTESSVSYNPFAYCENNPINESDPSGTSKISVLLDILRNSISFIAEIISMCQKLSENSIKQMKKIGLAAMNSKQRRNYKLEKDALKETKRLGKIFGVVGLIMAVVSIVNVYISNRRRIGATYAFAAVIAEVAVSFLCGAISFIISKLCNAIPYVGFLLKVVVSYGASYLLQLYFTAQRVYSIGQAIYKVLQESPYMNPSLATRKIINRTLWA